MLVLTALTVVMPAWSQSARPPGWSTDAQTGCRVWNDAPQPGEVMTWSGPCVNGLAHGQGTLRWAYGGSVDSYTGNMAAGREEGRGRYAWANGDIYNGVFSRGLPHGQGTYTSRQNSQVFIGNWIRGCFRQGSQTAAVGVSRRECGFE